MPGNEIGERVHNFFGQENLSQSQYHSQSVDGNWPGLSNNLWAGSQRPTGAPFISNLKNFNLQQSDPEQGHLRHGLNLAQSNLRPDSGRNQLTNQQTAVNGYMQGQQVFQSRQNEGNILGADTEADLHGISSLSRGIPMLESQQGVGLELYKKNMARSDSVESPVNYDFFGSQQQLSGRMLQSLPRQQSGMNEVHLLQQQAIFNQMQEFQRQQQFHAMDLRQQSSMTPASSVTKQTVPNHSTSLINGIPINEASNLMWQPEVITTNANWLQRSASPVMQESSNGVMLSPEQVRLMGFVPNQGDQSLYGLPISGSRGTPNLYSHVQADKPAVSQVSIPHQYSHIHGDKAALTHLSASGNSFPALQYPPYPDQTDTNDETPVLRQDLQGKNMFGSFAQGMNSGLNMENLPQMNSEQRNVPIEDFHGRQELAGSSETSQDKVLVQVPPSQNVATLDPTEEKILFGSDDNLWDGFSRNAGFNMLDGVDSFGGFPSLQSGSWSALMQSAVAETSSSEMGTQEEWSGLSLRNNEPSPGNERPSAVDSSKMPVWADNNLQAASHINSRPFLRPDDANKPNSVNYSGVAGFHQSSVDPAQERDRLQTDSSQRSIPQFLERGKWLDCSPQQKPIAEGNHIYGNAATSSDIEVNEKVISGSWTHQQMLSSPNSSSELFNRSNGWSSIKSATPDNNSTLKMRENENTTQPHRGEARHEMGHVPAVWEPDSDAKSSVGLEHVKSARNMQVCGEDSGMNGLVAVRNSGATWVSRQSNQQLPNIDAWRHTDPVGSYAGKYRHNMEKNPLVLESSRNEKLAGEVHDIENSLKERSTDGLVSNSSHHRVGMRESSSFDGNDPRSPKVPAGPGNRRPPVTRKFQFHPMGDVGADTEPHGNKHAINSQPLSHQPFGGLKGQDQSYSTQSKYGNSDENYTETEKGDSKSLDDSASKSILPGQIPKTLSSKSVGNYALNKTASSSQNILELLHKVDQSREHGIATKTSTSNCDLSSRVLDTESSDGSVVHPQRNQSLSQGFGLQLAPPSQRHPMTFSRVAQHVPSEAADKGPMWLASTQTIPSQESTHELRNNMSGSSGQTFDKAAQYSVLGNMSQAFSSGFPFSRIHAQSQNVANLGGKAANSQYTNATFVDRTVSMKQVEEYCERAQTSQSELASAQGISQQSGMDQFRSGDPSMQTLALDAHTAPHPSVTFSASLHGAPSKVLHNVWTSISGKQQPNASNTPSPLQPINVSEISDGPQKPGIENSAKDGNDLSRQQIFPDSVNAADETPSAPYVKEKVVNSIPDASQSNPAATSRDIEDFGRSLRPNNFMHQNFPLQNQVQSTKSIEIDPSNRDVKRFKVSDNAVDKQQEDSNHGRQSYGYDNMVKDVAGTNSSAPQSDPNILGFSTKPVDGPEKSALNASNSNRTTSMRSEHSMINPQMAPSWFEQYGTFKHGKILPMYDVRAMTPPKIMDPAFIVRNQSDSLHLDNSMERAHSLSDAGNSGESPMPSSVASEHGLSKLLPSAVESDLPIMRPKKRKCAASELIPWHKELGQDSERLQDISAAELDWSQAANRLIEKVEDDVEQGEEPAMKSKRRLVLTTQLMQQVLNPPPAAVLSADAKLHHESVIYSVARLVLGDACSSVSWSQCGGSKNLLPDKLESPKKNDQYSLKVEDFVGRMRKLESDLLRLDSRASILDLRVETQDLERFSVINRFAKFHGRGQNDGADTSSTSDANANAHKPHPQRYVSAHPMPRNLPDRVQCLSL